MKRIAIFASGEGTNAQQLIDHFRGKDATVALVACNNPRANVLSRAEKSGIPVLLINKEEFYTTDHILQKLSAAKIDWIVCAGFLWKIPGNILRAFPDRIVNIHPALLPKFGGKGMYGMHVHNAVMAAGEKESGITIHFLTEQYDEGAIILQKKCKIEKQETPASLASKVQALEHEWFPPTIEQLINQHT